MQEGEQHVVQKRDTKDMGFLMEIPDAIYQIICDNSINFFVSYNSRAEFKQLFRESTMC